jgi:hypothetical protein
MKKVKEYVYQLAVRKINDEEKNFELERDLIFTQKKLKKADAIRFTEKVDEAVEVSLQFIGTLLKPNKVEIITHSTIPQSIEDEFKNVLKIKMLEDQIKLLEEEINAINELEVKDEIEEHRVEQLTKQIKFYKEALKNGNSN